MPTNRQTSLVGSRLRAAASGPNSGVVALLLLLCVLMATTSPVFFSVDNGFNVASQMVFVLLLALGMTVVLITGGIDLSVGSVMGLSAGVVAYLVAHGMQLPVAILMAVLVGAFLGLLNGLMITKLGLPDFIATLAMLGVARGLLYLWTEGTPFLGYMTPAYYIIGGLTRPLGYLTVPIIASITAVAAVAVTLRYTSFGRHAYGVGSNADGAKRSGVSVARIRVLAYVVSGLLAGIAGVFLAGRTTTVAPTMGIGYEVQAIAAAIIGGAALSGGRGRAIGAVLGALTLAITANAINLIGISSMWQQVVIGSILLLSVVLDRVTALFRARTVHLPAPPVATGHAAVTTT
jgi:ribose transport system permease protein